MEEEKHFLPGGTLLQGGKYRIKRYISSGGFGCTYEAEHVMLEYRVAIKEFFVKDFCNRDGRTAHVTVGTTSKKGLVEKLRHKFVDEARSLCKLQHPGIVHVSDVFEENGTAYYVMDYIDGPSLADLVKRERPLPEARAVGYIRQVCEALEYVHSHNRLHLDIKPANVMVDGAGRAILIDFGVSKQYDEYAGENTSTLLGNTPGYAPPEQGSHNVKKFLPATDIYALGATLYKLLTGVTPPDATSRSSGDALPPLPKSVSKATRRAVLEALKLNKAERPQTVGEFLTLLDGGDDAEPDVTILDDPKPPFPPDPDEDKKPEPVKPKPEPVDKSHIGRYVAIVACAVGAIIGILVLMNTGKSPSDSGIQPIKVDPTVSQNTPPVAAPVKPAPPATAEPAKPKRFLVQGTVTDETTGKAISGAQVKSSDGNMETTDRNGKYSFTDGVEENAKLSVVYDSKTWKTRVVKKAGTYDFKLPLPVKTEPIATSTSGSSTSSPGSTSGRSSNNTATATSYKINGHEYVDLGLSVKWATCNVGASSPSDYGNYYAWGEVSTKSEYTDGNSKTYGKSYGNIGGNSSTDAARANWGGSWRLPTKSELEELKSKCTWTWTTMNGKNGYKVTGRNGNSIFLPAAGCRYGSSLDYAGSYGNCWSSTPNESDTDLAYYLRFDSDYHDVLWGGRNDGFSVRPVSE